MNLGSADRRVATYEDAIHGSELLLGKKYDVSYPEFINNQFAIFIPVNTRLLSGMNVKGQSLDIEFESNEANLDRLNMNVIHIMSASLRLGDNNVVSVER